MPPAARITDMHTCPEATPEPHVGGPVISGSPNVFINGLPAARMGDPLTCVGPPDVIAKGSTGVFINGLPAARMGDLTAHGGVIIGGSPNVIIGEIGAPSPGNAGIGGVMAGLTISEVVTPRPSIASAYSAPGAIVPAVYHPGAGGASLLQVAAKSPVKGMFPAERAVICAAVCQCDASPGLSSSGAQLKQLCVSSTLHAADAATGYRSTIKSEVSYDMTQSPPQPIMVNGMPTRPHPPGSFPGQKIPDFTSGAGMMRRPDVVIVDDPNLPPAGDNIRSVVEVKFPPDTLSAGQEDAYSKINGGTPPEVLSPQQCGCAQKQPERVPVPAPVPATEPEDHTVRNVVIGGALVAGAILLAPEEAVAAVGYGILRLGGLLLGGAAATAP